MSTQTTDRFVLPSDPTVIVPTSSGGTASPTSGWLVSGFAAALAVVGLGVVVGIAMDTTSKPEPAANVAPMSTPSTSTLTSAPPAPAVVAPPVLPRPVVTVTRTAPAPTVVVTAAPAPISEAPAPPPPPPPPVEAPPPTYHAPPPWHHPKPKPYPWPTTHPQPKPLCGDLIACLPNHE